MQVCEDRTTELCMILGVGHQTVPAEWRLYYLGSVGLNLWMMAPCGLDVCLPFARRLQDWRS